MKEKQDDLLDRKIFHKKYKKWTNYYMKEFAKYFSINLIKNAIEEYIKNGPIAQ